MTDEELSISDATLIARLRDLKTKLATCERHRDAYAECDRIGTQAVRDLETKLAENEVRLGKAVEALGYIESMAVHSGGEIHGVTALQWKVAFEEAQDVTRSVLAAVAEPHKIKSGVATTPYGLKGESHE